MNTHDIYMAAQLVSQQAGKSEDVEALKSRIAEIESNPYLNTHLISQSEFDALEYTDGVYDVYDDIVTAGEDS